MGRWSKARGSSQFCIIRLYQGQGRVSGSGGLLVGEVVALVGAA